MPVATVIDTDIGLITNTVVGNFSIDDAIAAFETYLYHADFKPDLDVLWDLSGGSATDLSVDDLRKMVELTSAWQQKRGSGYKIAIVVKEESDFNVAQMFRVFSQHLPREMMIFQNNADAITWLGLEQPAG